ncbi:MAG: hypothetical protein H6682_16720 [Candidatus Eisenbacteria bacterium]|nr:hypothetical protein [Candidatus Eisenbacteria bacterium]
MTSLRSITMRVAPSTSGYARESTMDRIADYEPRFRSRMIPTDDAKRIAHLGR